MTYTLAAQIASPAPTSTPPPLPQWTYLPLLYSE